MKKLIVLAFVLGACAADSEPQFDLVTCNDGEGMCQRACNSQAAQMMRGPKCDSTHTFRNGEPLEGLICFQTFEWNGMQGCCTSIDGQTTSDAEQYFLQCD